MMQTSHHWLAMGLLAVSGLTGCLDDSSPGPSVVIETGYLTCAIDEAACGTNAAACIDDDTASTCVETPRSCLDTITCACFGQTACGSRTCTDSADGLSLTCAAPEPTPATCEPGSSFPSADGCNTCSCPESGLLAEALCTLVPCALTTCEACLADGMTWQPQASACTDDCNIQDISCFSEACPGLCEDGCANCFSPNTCESQGCTWSQFAEAGTCGDTSDEPCAVMTPTALDFGAIQLGETKTMEVTLSACGIGSLTITSATLNTPGSTSFAIGGLPASAAEEPLTLPPDATATFTVTYSPTEASIAGPDGQLVADVATFFLFTDNNEDRFRLTTTGVAVDGWCPVAVIDLHELPNLPPQNILYLSGSNSMSAGQAPIVSYAWEIAQPVGSNSVFMPSASAENPTFEAAVTGVYTFKLMVTDSQGTRSCVAAERVYNRDF